MEHIDSFSSYHPIVNFAYFLLVFAFSMCFMHPLCLLISFVSALNYYYYLHKEKTAQFLMKAVAPMMLLTAVINPAFNHQGKIILYYLPSGNPFTLESVVYGMAAATMLSAVLLWFGCYSSVMTSDKFVYLFGRIVPALSLVLSMGLRFIPRFMEQFRQVKEAQAGIRKDTSNGSIRDRMKIAFACFSIMVTWSLENAIETADSMKCRGYGLQKRTAFSIYQIRKRDKEVLLWMGICSTYLLYGSLSGGLFWRYFPSIRGTFAEGFTISILLTYTALCFTPVWLDKREDRRWKLSRLKI